MYIQKGETEFESMGEAISGEIVFTERNKKYHLGTKKSLFYRAEWNAEYIFVFGIQNN